jgi:ABC-type multidrug transport system fused ATPase/permease subunit
VVITVSVVVTVAMCNPVTVVVAIPVVMRHMMMTIRVAALLLHLPGRHIAIAPAGLFTLVPASGTLVIVTVVIVVAIMVTVGVTVFIVVLVFIAATTVAVLSAFGERTRGHRKAKHQSQQNSIELGSHLGTSPDQLNSKFYAVRSRLQVTKVIMDANSLDSAA